MKSPPYDAIKDFEPVGLISVNPQLLVAKKDLAANTLPELVALMKKEPGKITFVNQNANGWQVSCTHAIAKFSGCAQSLPTMTVFNAPS